MKHKVAAAALALVLLLLTALPVWAQDEAEGAETGGIGTVVRTLGYFLLVMALIFLMLPATNFLAKKIEELRERHKD